MEFNKPSRTWCDLWKTPDIQTVNPKPLQQSSYGSAGLLAKAGVVLGFGVGWFETRALLLHPTLNGVLPRTPLADVIMHQQHMSESAPGAFCSVEVISTCIGASLLETPWPDTYTLFTTFLCNIVSCCILSFMCMFTCICIRLCVRNCGIAVLHCIACGYLSVVVYVCMHA